MGAVLHGSGYVTSGAYTGGIIATGTGGQTCDLTFSTPSGGTAATATVALSSLNTISTTPPPTINIVTPGKNYTSAPTTAAVSSGTAICTGTASVTTKLDDPLGLSGVPYLATTVLDPQNVTYSPSTDTYGGLTIYFTGTPYNPNSLTLDCGPTASVTAVSNNSADNGYDTLSVGNCTFHSIITAGFTATLAMPANTFPAPLPFPFSARMETSPNTASSGIIYH